MLIRLESSFIDTVSQLNANFSEKEKQQLASNIESKYNDIISIIKDLEQKKVKSGLKIIEIGNMGGRVFGVRIYYSSGAGTGGVPVSVARLVPAVSPVRM